MGDRGDTRSGRLTGFPAERCRIVALVFRARVTGGTLATATDETIQLCWLTPEEVRDRADEVYAVRVFDAFRDGTAVRSHDGVSVLDGKDVAWAGLHS